MIDRDQVLILPLDVTISATHILEYGEAMAYCMHGFDYHLPKKKCCLVIGECSWN